MSTTTEARIAQMVEREERELREGLQRAMDRGGMPTEAEFLEAEAKLRDAYNMLEDITIRLGGIENFAGHVDPELPFEITSEHVGLVAGFARILDTDLVELRMLVDGIEQAVYGLELIRRERSDAS